MQYLSTIFFAIVLNVTAQMALKAGMNRIGYFEFASSNILPIFSQIIRSPYILFGISCYVFSLGAWLLTLSRMDVSVAYPLTSLGYILTTIVGIWFLQEDFSWVRICGVLVIIMGVYLVARS